MATFRTKAGDLKPDLIVTCLDSSLVDHDSNPEGRIDLTAATAVKARIRRPDGTTVERTCTKLSQTPVATRGQVKVNREASDLIPGTSQLELLVTWPTSLPQTLPPAGTETIVTEARLPDPSDD